MDVHGIIVCYLGLVSIVMQCLYTGISAQYSIKLPGTLFFFCLCCILLQPFWLITYGKGSELRHLFASMELDRSHPARNFFAID